MKKMLAISLVALGGACVPAEPIGLSPAEQAEFAEATRGYTAGPATNCVNLRDIRGNRSIGEGVILFEGLGNALYVNRPAAGCPEVRPGRTLVTRTSSGQLCRGDIATVVDPVSGIEYGGCGLGDFIPYRRQ